jgi:ADP-ribose pyrophosphatase YjhB (NUDIX family)
MKDDKSPQWLKWAREIQSLSQTGLAFAETDYEKNRYNRLAELAAEITESQTNLSSEKTAQIFMNQPGYATPKIDVRGAIIKDGEILLVQEKTDERWAMPGGWADVGDFPASVAERETEEESGYLVKAKKVVGVFDANRSGRPMEFFHAFKIIFLCDLIGGDPKTSDETIDVGFFSFDNLPPLSQNRTNDRYLNEVKLHLEDPNRATCFD